MTDHDESPTKPITIDTTIEIQTSPSDAFQFWRALENLPRVMSHVHEVKPLGDNQYKWTVKGPLTTEVSWLAEVTRVEVDSLIAWRSLEGATVPNSGEVHFEPSASGATRLHVHLEYAPPLGAIGHAIATLFGVNPKQQIDEDLKKCKSLLEQGIAESDGAIVTEQGVRERVDESRQVH